MLKFQLGPIPVTVSASFLFVAFIGGSFEPVFLVPWVVGVFLAILIHEAGHAFTARAFGIRQVSITLFALGGATMYPADPSLTPKRRFVVAAAGSAVAIAAGTPFLVALRTGLIDRSSPLLFNLVFAFVFAAVGWGILNWAPIRPLDGGQMMTSLLEIVIPRRAEVVSKVASLVFGLVAAWIALRFDQRFAAVFVLIITLIGVMSPSVEAQPAGAGPTGPAPEPDRHEPERDVGPPPAFPI
ncbi:MAG TPA: site-2 protease family protein [Acidimicrobiia bacterium]|jgi:Zn-dependent protease